MAQAEAGLHTGELTVVSDLGTGAKATATLTFDLGDAQHPPRLHITSVYSSPAGTQTDERIIIGGTSWQHQANGQWVTADETEGVWGRVQAYLPRASAATNPTVDGGASPVLRWNDATRGGAVTLHFDPATGVPSELQLAPSGGPAVDVKYSNWNGPVTITQPAK